MASRTGVGHQAPCHRTRGCRVVTTSLTARVLLANQLRSMPEVDWTVVSGDPYDDPPDGVTVEVIPIRREFALSDAGSFVGLWRYLREPALRLRADPHPQGVVPRPAGGQAGRQPGHLHHPRRAVLRGQRPGGQHPRLVLRAVVLPWADRVLVQSREDEQGLPKVHGSVAVASWTYVGNGIVHGPVSGAGGAGAAVGPTDRDDGQPAGAGEGVRRLPGPGRVAGRPGRLRPRRPVRARPARRADRGGGGGGLRVADGDVRRRGRRRPSLPGVGHRGRPPFLPGGHPPGGHGGCGHGPAGGRLRHPGGARGHRSRPRAAGPPRGPAGTDRRGRGAAEGPDPLRRARAPCRQWVVARFSEDRWSSGCGRIYAARAPRTPA